MVPLHELSHLIITSTLRVEIIIPTYDKEPGARRDEMTFPAQLI